jgi:hypothetical protein
MRVYQWDLAKSDKLYTLPLSTTFQVHVEQAAAGKWWVFEGG